MFFKKFNFERVTQSAWVDDGTLKVKKTNERERDVVVYGTFTVLWGRMNNEIINNGLG